MKKTNNKGFTMAELMIVVAILAILAALGVIGLVSYRKNLHQMEMDSIAKELFITAQNHLSMSEGQGFHELADSVSDPSPFGTMDAGNPGVYYFIVSSPPASDDETVLGLMFPMGSIDNTVMNSGNFIIRYQRSPATVLDVFYAKTGTERYTHSFSDDDYAQALLLRDTKDEDGKTVSKKRERGDCFEDHAVMGWYGGDDLASGALLKSPVITVKNEERLLVEVEDKNTVTTGYKLQLILVGKSSKAVKTFNFITDSSHPEHESVRISTTDNATSKTYTVVLDDIGTTAKMHFAKITDNDRNESFYPGETISVQAKAFSTSALTNVATSELRLTNSLFDSATTVSGTGAKAVISNIRHLENLSGPISGFGNNVTASEAVQTKDLYWEGSAEGFRETYQRKYTPEGGTTVDPKIISLDAVAAAAGYFRAVQLRQSSELAYDGGYHSITGISVDETTISDKSENAGLFASLPSGSSVKNLELIDFTVAGTTSAGALAGMLTNTAVTNVIARNSGVGAETKSAVNISATAASSSAGGLIGSMSGGTVSFSAASVNVTGTAAAGGLIGTASGTINGCYSGGHTKEGSYTEWVGVAGHSYDVTGATAGGLAGSSSATITNCYSTCSVQGKSEDDASTAGGFVGNNSGSITHSYCTGLVTGSPQYAFLGAGSLGLSDCWYYEIINEDLDADPIYMLPYDGYSLTNQGDVHQARIKAIDHIIGYYDGFVGAQSSWTNAAPYDTKLTTYYHATANTAQAKYNLRSIARLGSSSDPAVTIPANYYVNTHYGDWPAPEIFIINSNS